ncbi:MAG: hypothetical protein V1934_02420 [Methanobacteriota archaeon]
MSTRRKIGDGALKGAPPKASKHSLPAIMAVAVAMGVYLILYKLKIV